MKLERLFIKFDDGEHFPVILKCSSIITMQEGYYNPYKLDSNGHYLRSETGVYQKDYSKRNPLLSISCSNSIIIKVQDITLDEFMNIIRFFSPSPEAGDQDLHEKILKNYAYSENELNVHVMNQLDVNTY